MGDLAKLLKMSEKHGKNECSASWYAADRAMGLSALRGLPCEAGYASVLWNFSQRETGHNQQRFFEVRASNTMEAMNGC